MSAPAEYDVDLGSISLSVRDFKGGEPPVIALHGLASNARWWDLVAERLHPVSRVVAVDQRGHGRSAKPDTGYTIEQCTTDLRALVEVLGLGRAVIAGHSWGASVALSYAAAFPELTAGVICIDGGVSDLRSIFGDSWDEAAIAMRPPNLEGITEQQLRHWIEMSPLADASDAVTGLGILMGNFESDGRRGLRPRLTFDRHMAIARDLYEFDIAGTLARITSPVLLMMAALGRPGTASGERTLTSKQGGVDLALARLGTLGAAVWIEGEHDLPVQRPDEVATAMAAFIESLPRTAVPRA